MWFAGEVLRQDIPAVDIQSCSAGGMTLKYSSAWIPVLLFVILLPVSIGATGLIFETAPFSFQALRTLGYSVNGGADIGECLVTCSRIADGDTESWYTEWMITAERVEAKADSFLAGGFTISAMECYFRASHSGRTGNQSSLQL